MEKKKERKTHVREECKQYTDPTHAAHFLYIILKYSKEQSWPVETFQTRIYCRMSSHWSTTWLRLARLLVMEARQEFSRTRVLLNKRIQESVCCSSCRP